MGTSREDVPFQPEEDVDPLYSLEAFQCPWEDVCAVRMDPETGEFDRYGDLYTGTEEEGTLVEMVGYGVQGTQQGNGDWLYNNSLFGSQQSADNYVSPSYPYIFSILPDWGPLTKIGLDFDGTRSGNAIDRCGDNTSSLTFEGIAGGRDSGGPVMESGGENGYTIMGIMAEVAHPLNYPSFDSPNFGSATIAARTSTLQRWAAGIADSSIEASDGFLGRRPGLEPTLSRGSWTGGYFDECCESDNTYMSFENTGYVIDDEEEVVPSSPGIEVEVYFEISGTVAENESLAFSLETAAQSGYFLKVDIASLDENNHPSGAWVNIYSSSTSSSDTTLPITIPDADGKMVADSVYPYSGFPSLRRGVSWGKLRFRWDPPSSGSYPISCWARIDLARIRHQ
jgi:hypothetical protein